MPITITNTLGASTHIQARAVKYSDAQTPTVDWTRITSTPLAAGASLTTTLPGIPLGPWLQIELRREDDNTVAVVGDRCGVGPKFNIEGQSREAIAFRTRELTDTTVLDGTVPGGASNMSFWCVHNDNAVEGNVAFGILRERCEAGEGAKLLAREWTAAYPNNVFAIGCTAIPGRPRSDYYNNIARGGWLASMSRRLPRFRKPF